MKIRSKKFLKEHVLAVTRMLVKRFNILLKFYPGLVYFSSDLSTFDYEFVDPDISNIILYLRPKDRSNNHLLRTTLNYCKHIENLKENFKNLG